MMFQIVVSYLDDRYGCFFTEKAITDYDELLNKIKDAVLYIRNIPHARVRVSYKDVNLSGGSETAEGVFISTSPGDSMVRIIYAKY